jgi:hypothetical protein
VRAFPIGPEHLHAAENGRVRYVQARARRCGRAIRQTTSKFVIMPMPSCSSWWQCMT